MKKKLILAVLTPVMFCHVLFAQEQDSARNLNEVVITATKEQRSVFETGRSITVITGKEIAESGAITLMDILANVDGASVIGTGQNYGAKSTLFLRGAAGNHSLVMIDGVRLSDPTSPDNGLDISEISLANIDRIEIVKGSHSTMYGSSAIGGVVNIITKGADTAGLHVNAHWLGGAFAGNSDWDGEDENGLAFDYKLNLDYQFKSGLYANAGINAHHSKGFNSTVDTVITSGVYKHTNQADPFDKFGYNARLGYKANKMDAFFSYRKEMQGSEIDDGGFVDDDNHFIESYRDLFNYGIKYAINDKFNIGFSGGYTLLDRRLVDDSSKVDTNVSDQTFLENNYMGTSLNNDLLLTGKFKALTLSLGANHTQETMTGDTYIYSNSMWGVYEDSTNLDSLHLNTSTTGVYLHADIEGNLFSEKCSSLVIGLGARFSNHSRFGSVATWEFSPGYKFSNKGMLYFSVATGFNAPSLYQLYTPEKDFFSGIQRGNPDLKPETSISYELGIKQKINAGMFWTAALFHTQVRNTIEYVYLWDGSKPIDSLTGFDYKADRYLNMGETQTSGLELTVHSKLTEKLSISLALTVLGGKYIVEKAESDTDGTFGHHVQIFSNGAFVEGVKEISGAPRRSSNGRVSLQWKPVKQLSIEPGARYVGNRTDLMYDATLGPWGAQTTTGLSDYLLLDLNINYAVNKRLGLSLRGENLTNQTYQEIRGYASRGMGVYFRINGYF